MNNIKNNFLIQIVLASFCGALSVMFGAFSAHTLENLVKNGILNIHSLQVFEKGVKYQFYHSIVLLILALFNFISNKEVFKLSFWFIFAGILFFSGSLYWISLQEIIHINFPKTLFWITPLGGLLFILGWILIIFDIKKIIS